MLNLDCQPDWIERLLTGKESTPLRVPRGIMVWTWLEAYTWSLTPCAQTLPLFFASGCCELNSSLLCLLHEVSALEQAEHGWKPLKPSAKLTLSSFKWLTNELWIWGLALCSSDRRHPVSFIISLRKNQESDESDMHVIFLFSHHSSFHLSWECLSHYPLLSVIHIYYFT